MITPKHPKPLPIAIPRLRTSVEFSIFNQYVRTPE
jgi:hypothetical protein